MVNTFLSVCSRCCQNFNWEPIVITAVVCIGVIILALIIVGFFTIKDMRDKKMEHDLLTSSKDLKPIKDVLDEIRKDLCNKKP